MPPSSIPAASTKQRRNLARSVVAYISDSIRGGTISPGERLPTETEIMRILGVSRTVVREAISHAQAAGMVETRHGVGTFVLTTPPAHNLGIDPGTVITMRDVLAILELRISLETESASLAAMRRTDKQLQALRATLDNFQLSVQNGRDTVAADVQFHLAIAHASGNRYFYDILKHLGKNIIPRARVNSARIAHDEPSIYVERVAREHDDIFNAISRKDPEAARAAMRTHLSNNRERLRRAQEQLDGTAS